MLARGRTGKLEVQINSVLLADGTRVPLRAVNAGADGSRIGTVTTMVAVVSIVFFPAAPLALLIKGKDLTIPKGTFVTAYINGDLPLDAEKLDFFGKAQRLACAAGTGDSTWRFATIFGITQINRR